jgi:hypothetical protein
MSVLLYLLPLGLIFDLMGYTPPALRLFMVFLLLALPLCIKPSRRSAWLGVVLLLGMGFRSWVDMPVVAETMLLLLLHLLIWSAAAPVPRPLRLGVTAYAFVHLFLFLSPLGHPLVEGAAVALNRVMGLIAGQAFHLGPTYLGLGGLGLFLTLSVFSWDGTRTAVLRSAGFLAVILLVNALAAVILLEKTDFGASFAWSLKFREAFRFPELWQHLKGLAVIGFPKFLFLAQLAVYLILHFGRSEKKSQSTVEPVAPGRSELLQELLPGIRRTLLGGLAGLVVLVVVPPTCWRNPAPREMVFLEKGVVSFSKPDYVRYGESAGGMFGMFPEYARLFGSESQVVKELPEVLDPRKILVMTNVDFELTPEQHRRLWEFVENGGGLWVLGDHTFIKNGRNHLNELLSPVRISFHNDSAQFFPQGWFHSYRFLQGTPFATLRDDAENRPGILVGASLDVRVPAKPLVIGRFGYSDWGTDSDEGNRGHLGDFKYQPSERLGDLVLVAGQRHGKGRVLVFGDTSSFFNNNLARSYELLRASIAWLGDSNKWEIHASRPGRWLALVLVSGLVMAAFLWRRAALGAHTLGAAMLVSLLTHGTGGLPDFEPEFARGHLAVLDYFHQPNASKHSAMDSGLHGVSINLLRHGKLPVALNDWNPEVLDVAKYVVLNAPRRPVDGRTRRDLTRFMERGGIVILGCGYLDAAGSREWLESLGCRISGIPLGRFFDRPAFGQPVSFMSAWAIEEIPDNAEILCASADWPLMVKVPVGKGALVWIGDSEFLHNRNLEGHKNHDPANTAFIKNLLDSTQ